jgi:lipopolysaccharide/colanic/teichoic acid biosynthesis glycosyltransferase
MMHWGHPCRDKVALFLGDIGLIALLAIAGWYVHPAGTIDAAQKALSLAVLLPTFVAAIYVFDLYSLAALNGLGTFFKVTIAVGAASVLCNALFHLFQLEIPGSRSIETCALILPWATYLWRRSYLHGSRRFQAPENLVVIGTIRNREILRAAVDGINPRYRLLGMFCVEPDEVQGPSFERESDSERLMEFGGAREVFASSSDLAGTALATLYEPETAVCVMELDDESAGAMPDLGPAAADDVLQVVAAYDVKAVVVRNEAMNLELAGVLTRLRFNGIRVYSLPDFCMHVSEELPLETLNESWLCVADGFDLLQARFFRRVKRLADLFLAAAGLLAALPFMLVAAVAIRLESSGPILFRQQRVGRMGRRFELLKFRSMRAGAETARGPQWASVNDPRITNVGRILRKTHFDELPQMINILRGEMSFVGPRPERPEFVRLLNESISFYHLRHYVLPGITGWAQVNYPYGASMEDARRKLQYDLYYVCNASPLLDLRTLLRTARVVLFRKGSR